MSITWETLLADLRRDLKDTSSKPKWSDEELYMYTVDAVYDYSVWFPQRKDKVELTESSGSYPLPVDYIEDVTLENPEDRFLEKREDIPGRKYSDTLRPVYYYISGGNLYLNGSSLVDDGIYLTYFALHDIPTSETDTTFVFTVPLVDVELLRLYVRGQVHEQMRSKTARLDRFDPGSGRRDDNPLAKETNLLLSSYYDKVARRIGGGSITLYRPGSVR
jgi:hypothetical protein